MFAGIIPPGQQDRIERLAAFRRHHVRTLKGDHQFLNKLFLTDYLFFQYIGKTCETVQGVFTFQKRFVFLFLLRCRICQIGLRFFAHAEILIRCQVLIQFREFLFQVLVVLCQLGIHGRNGIIRTLHVLRCL